MLLIRKIHILEPFLGNNLKTFMECLVNDLSYGTGTSTGTFIDKKRPGSGSKYVGIRVRGAQKPTDPEHCFKQNGI
jgi:hypothetical protein